MRRTINPFKWQGVWVFNDESFGLDHEPFVAGADAIIDKLVENIPDAAEGFSLEFSDQPLPGSEELTWVREEIDGNVYEWRGMTAWLCPALNEYFPKTPRSLFVKACPSGSTSTGG
jgi:hypothetical protein